MLLHTTLTLGMMSCGEEAFSSLYSSLCRVLIVVHVSAVPSAGRHLWVHVDLVIKVAYDDRKVVDS